MQSLDNAAIMTWQIAFMLVLMAVALVAFVKELLPIEVTALAILAVLLLTRIIDVHQAISGFSSTAVIAIGSLFVLSQALTKTGILETIADRVGDRARNRPRSVMTLLLVAVAIGSGILNNTAVVALTIPLIMKLCRRLSLSPSKVLLPLSYASILGGTLTLIGTSTNLLVSSLMDDAGAEPFAVFEFSLFGGLLLIVGMLYIIFFSNKLLPARATAGTLTDRYLSDRFLTEVLISENSELIGHNLSENHINERYGVTILEVIREGGDTHLEDVGTISLKQGDHLLVLGDVEKIMGMRRDLKLTEIPDRRLADQQLTGQDEVLVEAWIAPGSRLIDHTLKQLDFHHHYGAFVLAVRRVGSRLTTRLGDVTLHLADALLILAPRQRLDDLEESGDLKILSEHEFHLRRGPFWWLVLIVLPMVVVSAALGWMDIAAGAFIGAVVLLIFRVMKPDEAYRAINWPVLFMIAAFVPVGKAFQVTGTADFLARGLLSANSLVSPGFAPYLVLALIYIVTSSITQIASNSAAAIIVAPIAMNLGPSLGVDSRPFVVAVCFAASAAFLSPMGYQTNLMVYAPGEYQFADYARFGFGLSLLMWILSVVLIPVFWPF